MATECTVSNTIQINAPFLCLVILPCLFAAFALTGAFLPFFNGFCMSLTVNRLCLFLVAAGGYVVAMLLW